MARSASAVINVKIGDGRKVSSSISFSIFLYRINDRKPIAAPIATSTTPNDGGISRAGDFFWEGGRDAGNRPHEEIFRLLQE